MILRYARDLSTQTIVAHGQELASVCALDRNEQGERVYTWPDSKTKDIATILKPVLVTDDQTRQKLSPTVRITIQKLFQSPLVRTEYDGMTFDFVQNNYPGVRWPSIDTLLFTKALSNLDLDAITSAAEWWCGSGFISKYVIRKAPNLKQLHIMDINPHAIQCARDQIQSSKARYYLGNAINNMQGKKVDLLICNPPYVPRAGSSDDNPYEGIGLLYELIMEGKKYLNPWGKIITNYSSLWDDPVVGWLQHSWWNITILDEMRVPLKICNILNNEEWMGYLMKEKWLKKENRTDYEYWHTIKIVQLS